MRPREAKYGFGKRLRLRKGREFRWVLKGERLASRYLTLVFRRGPAPSRVGLTVSRKVGNAIQRNRIKRICREFFRLRREELRPPVAMVLIARPGCAEASGALLREELVRLFELCREQANRPARGKGADPSARGGRGEGVDLRWDPPAKVHLGVR